MVPFMSDEIKKVFRKLCSLVLKPEVVNEASTPYNLIKITVSDKNNQKEYMKKAQNRSSWRRAIHLKSRSGRDNGAVQPPDTGNNAR